MRGASPPLWAFSHMRHWPFWEFPLRSSLHISGKEGIFTESSSKTSLAKMGTVDTFFSHARLFGQRVSGDLLCST